MGATRSDIGLAQFRDDRTYGYADKRWVEWGEQPRQFCIVGRARAVLLVSNEISIGKKAEVYAGIADINSKEHDRGLDNRAKY
jgi:hypothetical protein